MRLMTLLLLAFISFSSIAQENALDFYGDVMINALEPDHKAYAASQFHTLLEKRLSDKNSFSDKLRDIEWISKIYPMDSTFRVLSYQVEINEHQFKSFGYIQKSDGKLIKLSDQSTELGEDAPYTQTDQNSWFGALYYNILEFDFEGQTQYLLFGYDGYSEFDRRKVVDVISAINGDEVIFGNEIFVKKTAGERDDRMQRIIISYSSDSNVTLNYNPSLDMIVHDHLIPRIGSIPGQGATYLSDGSLVGYRYENNEWIFTPDLFTDVTAPSAAPRPHPVLGQDKKTNIFGRQETTKKKRPKK